MTRIVILGGGPAGYEAALVAAQHEADVTVVEEDSLGGNCVAYDCVPSKTFIASAGVRAGFRATAEMGVDVDDPRVDLPRVNARVHGLALAQSADVRTKLQAEGVRVVQGRAWFEESDRGQRHPRRVHRVPRRLHRDGHRRRRPRRHRRVPARAARRAARREADPDLAPDLRPRRAARAPHRGRLRRHRRRVRLRVRRAGRAGDADLEPRPRPAARGPGRRDDARGGVHRARGDHRAALAGRQGRRHRRRRAGHAVRRPRGRGLARPDDRRLGAQHRRPRPGQHRPRAARERPHHRRPRLPHRGPRRLRRRRLHRPAAAGVGRGDAGPDRDVARAGRGRRPAAAQDRRLGGVHPPRGGHRRHQPRAGGERGVPRPRGHPAAGHEPAREDVGPARGLRQGVLPAGDRASSSAASSSRRWPAS